MIATFRLHAQFRALSLLPRPQPMVEDATKKIFAKRWVQSTTLIGNQRGELFIRHCQFSFNGGILDLKNWGVGIGLRSFTTSSTDSTSSDPENIKHWDLMYEALKEYNATHGDTFVPATYPPNPPLGNWVDNQRQLYRMRLERDQSVDPDDLDENKPGRFISDERIEKLNNLGFVWNLNEHIWNSKFEELKSYVEENGHTLVPIHDAGLGFWVAKQRRRYKVQMMKKGKKSQKSKSKESDEAYDEVGISEERIRKLEEIGFVWDVHVAQWAERLEELKKYRQDHGDTLVPKSYSVYPFLGRWVDKQRLDYKRFMTRKESGIIEKNKPTGMTEERIRLLEAVDFIWDPYQYAWDLKYSDLCDFVAANGHCGIRERRGKYNPLARWATTQRQQYQKYLNGEKTSMTEERIEKLNRIGFIWDKSDINDCLSLPVSKAKRKTAKQTASGQNV